MINQKGVYSVGLNQKREAVISAHFMHEINLNLKYKLYAPKEFSQKAVPINLQSLHERLIPSLLESSHKFILERVAAAKIRAKKNYKKYGLNTPEQVGVAEMIAEVMFDRQFLKGSKSNVSRLLLIEKIRELTCQQKPIKMVIPALPYKSSSPLKCRGILPDLSEVNFLLGLAEIAKTVAHLYSEQIQDFDKNMAEFTVICDGGRFNEFLNEPNNIIEDYQTKLHWWIHQLQISNYVKILDYRDVLKDLLPYHLQVKKAAIREDVKKLYRELMLPLFNPNHIIESIHKAIELDPEPELCNPEGRYIPLFKSLIYTVRYNVLLKAADALQQNYVDLYTTITRHILEPYTELTPLDIEKIEEFILHPLQKHKPPEIKLLEYLRQAMLREAWYATINYIAEIRSDRDLSQEPILACFPDHIRWTIHEKPGQLAILTTTAFGDPVQPWHGVGVFKLTKNNKIKLYTLPILLLEGEGAIPVKLEENGLEAQPLFYVYPDITFKDIQELLEKIKRGLMRKRKL